jgi:hypothetical protein
MILTGARAGSIAPVTTDAKTNVRTGGIALGAGLSGGAESAPRDGNTWSACSNVGADSTDEAEQRERKQETHFFFFVGYGSVSVKRTALVTPD